MEQVLDHTDLENQNGTAEKDVLDLGYWVGKVGGKHHYSDKVEQLDDEANDKLDEDLFAFLVDCQDYGDDYLREVAQIDGWSHGTAPGNGFRRHVQPEQLSVVEDDHQQKGQCDEVHYVKRDDQSQRQVLVAFESSDQHINHRHVEKLANKDYKYPE